MPVAEISVQPASATGAASLGSAIELRGVGKRFPAGPVILDGVDLTVQPGEIVSLVGPSGCGKSTLLRLLAGLDREHTGAIAVGGTAIAGPSRSVGFMFQEPRLLPWLTVAQNIAFGIAPARRADSAAIVRRLLDQVHLDGSAKLYPRQLSGGMQQRVALARALAAEPSVLLLDEPFSALDAFTRIHLQDLVLELWQRTGLTMVLVTHEVDEALYLSDRVVVFSERPARIAETVAVKLARPRDRRDPALLELRGHLLEQLRLAGRWDRRKPEYEI